MPRTGSNIPGIYEEKGAELIPKRVLKAFRESGKLIDGRGAMCAELKSKLVQVLTKQQDETRQKVMVVFFDGFPGSGKSSMSLKFQEEVMADGILPQGTITRFPLDLFLGTARKSAERKTLTNSPGIFEAKFIRYEKAREILQRMLAQIEGHEEGSIQIDEAYLRGGDHSGTFGSHQLPVNRDTRLVIVEGVGSINYLAGPDGFAPQVQPYTVFMHMRKEESLFRATLRDVLNGRDGLTFEQIHDWRTREYELHTPRLLPSVQGATKICKRFKSKDDFMDNLAKKEAEILAANEAVRRAGVGTVRMTIAQALAQVDPNFLRKVFPGTLPKDFNFTL